MYEDIKKKKEEVFSKKNSSYIGISNLIGDKSFAAFINYEGEIVVENFLYKFTPKGLFFGKLNKTSEIRNIALSDYKAKIIEPISICEYRRTEGGTKEIEEGVYRYIAPLDEFDSCDGGGFSGGGSTGGTSTNLADPKTDRTALFEMIDKLEVIKTDDHWFQNIFGDYRYAHKYFNNRDYRFELDYHSQRYLIYRSVGLEAETHKEGWFWWNNIDSDEIILGINKIHAVIKDLPKPKIETLTLGEVFPNLNQTKPLYIHNDSFMIENNGIYDPVSVKVLANKGFPYFKHYDDPILNIYVGKVLGYTVDQGINYNVLNDSNIKSIYKLGLDYFKKHANSKKEAFFVTVQKSPTQVDLYFFNEFIRKYNTDEVQRNIVSEYAGQVSGEIINGEYKTDWVTTVKDLITGEAFYGKYEFKELDFYGIARRGNEWKGLKIKRKEN